MLKFIWILVAMLSSSIQAALPEVSSGKIVRLKNMESKYIPTRNVDVWLPPHFSIAEQYPVIYMHDGQMLFDAQTTWNGQEWKVDEVASKLIKEEKVPPFIVVGIWNGDKYRHSEYFPQKPFHSLTAEYQEHLYQAYRSPELKLFNTKVYSDNYLKFIVDELMPLIESKYPIKRNASYLMGSSMGGLISWYGLMEYPEKFAGSASLSSHWPGSFESDDNPIPQQFLSYISKKLPQVTEHRLYFDTGTETLDAMYAKYHKQLVQILRKSAVPKHKWRTKVFEEANHTEDAWSKRLDLPLFFLLKP